MTEYDSSALHAYLSKEARTAWRTFSEENGVSVTGLLESLGLNIAEELDGHEADDIRQDWVKAARRIDVQRRRRGQTAA